tara:strand:- start:121 stop:558 length:438 start_codon:yes stop_codon:yes gene_type:complete
MKNVKLFEEFVNEADSMAELKKFAKNFKKDWFEMEEGNASEEEIMVSWENITSYLGGEQLVTISEYGRTSSEFEFEPVIAMNAIIARLEKGKAIEDYHSGEAYYAKLDGAKAVATYDPGTSTLEKIYINIKDAKKFDLDVIPFAG